MIISYAQNFEDAMLWRALKDVKKGFYIDIGANDPTIDSVTKLFYDEGWSGINIEPVLHWFEKTSLDRPRDINLPIAVGDKTGEMTIYDLPDTGLSTSDQAIAERHEKERGYVKQEIVVPVKTLAEIFAHYHVAEVHFLKIDVEGAEKSVLEGADFSVVRPWIVLIEATLPISTIESHSEWEQLIVKWDYQFVFFDGLNRFYIDKKRPTLVHYFNSPINYFDNVVLTAKSPFCSLLNNRIHDQNESIFQKDQIILNKDQIIAEKEQELILKNKMIDDIHVLNVDIEKLLAEQQQKSRDLKASWDETLQHLAEVTQQKIAIEARLDDLSQTVTSIYESRSLKITRPLRYLAQQVRLLKTEGLWSRFRKMIKKFPLLRKLVCFTKSVLKVLFAKIIRLSIKLLNKLPYLKTKIQSLITKYPKLKKIIHSSQGRECLSVAHHSETESGSDSDVNFHVEHLVKNRSYSVLLNYQHKK